MQQRLDLRWRLIPPLFQRGLPSMFRDRDIGGVEFTVANDLHTGNRRNFLADQLED